MARKSKQVTAQRWELPGAEKADEALRYFHARPRSPVKQTLPFVIHNPSGWKRDRLVDAHIYATELRDSILERWQEDWQKPRKDGALTHILDVQDKGRYKSRTFGETVRKTFVQASDSSFISRFHESICHDGARNITSWAQNVIKLAVEHHRKEQQELQRASGEPPTKQPKYEPTLDDVYRVWVERERAYQQAAESIISFGRKAGETLEKHGKREARWLLDHLLPDEEIVDLLKYVNLLLDERPSVQQSEAAMIEHKWRRYDSNPADEPHQYTAVRESHLLQRLLKPVGESVLLGRLHKSELAALGKELREMLDYSEEFKASLQQLHAAIAETHDSAEELSDLREALDIFLNGRPYSYPTITRREWSGVHQQQLQQIYETWLNWFVLDEDKPKRVERFLSEQLETMSKNGLERANSALKPPRWSPIPFNGTMHPGQYRDFALLYNRQTGQITLAIVLYKKGTFGHDYEPQHRSEKTPKGKKAQRDYAKRRAFNPLYYVNFPETRFRIPKGTAVLLFPLSYGQEYQARVMNTIITHQRKAQKRIYAEQNHNIAIAIEKCLPYALVKSAKILCHWDEHGKPVFSVNVTMEPPVEELPPVPTRVIGFHEHNEGYSYAVLELDGMVRDVGDLRIARHVDPARGAKPNTDNYVYYIANTMVAKAALWEAYIGIEDTSYKKKLPDLSRKRNREVFSRPSIRIVTATKDKALMEGMLTPRAVPNVAPTRDCAQCRTRLIDEQGGANDEQVVRCPTCKTHQQYDKESRAQHCIACGGTWLPDDQDITEDKLFSCSTCRAPARLAQYNTAIVVAQRVLIDLVRHHENALKAEKERKQQFGEEG